MRLRKVARLEAAYARRVDPSDGRSEELTNGNRFDRMAVVKNKMKGGKNEESNVDMLGR
jgi:hypothetical protein